MSENKVHIVLLGDVGGTNIRLELVTVDTSKDNPLGYIKKDNLKVDHFKEFHHAIEAFLNGVETYPEVAVIGMAGPVFDNSVSMANAVKWGLL
jgi:glucokinase